MLKIEKESTQAEGHRRAMITNNNGLYVCFYHYKSNKLLREMIITNFSSPHKGDVVMIPFLEKRINNRYVVTEVTHSLPLSNRDHYMITIKMREEV